MIGQEFEEPAKPIEIPIEGGRTLRQIFLEDLEELLAFFAANKEFFRTYAPKLAEELCDRQRLAHEIIHPPIEGRLQFAGIEDSKLFGYFTLDPTTVEGPAEIGYSVGESFTNRGLATEAVKALLKYAFEHLNESKVGATIEVGNEPSRKIVDKLGFSFTSEHDVFYKSRIRRIQQFELTKEELAV